MDLLNVSCNHYIAPHILYSMCIWPRIDVVIYYTTNTTTSYLCKCMHPSSSSHVPALNCLQIYCPDRLFIHRRAYQQQQQCSGFKGLCAACNNFNVVYFMWSFLPFCSVSKLWEFCQEGCHCNNFITAAAAIVLSGASLPAS
jgi:hypothetical protein